MKTKDELKEMFSTGKKPTGADFAELIDGTEGPRGEQGIKGDTGETGQQGEKGNTGNTGSQGPPGFGTQQQYDAIIARLDALEATTP